MSRLPLLAALPIALALAAGACAAPNATRISAMTQETPSSATATTRTWCIGRFLIDMPVGARLSGGGYKYNFGKIAKPEAMDLKQFEEKADAREAALRTQKHEKENGLLRVSQRPDSTTRLMAFWKNDVGEYMVQIEGSRWIEKHRFVINAEASTSRQDFALQVMADRIARVRPRADDEIPTEPGYCFEGGFIADAEWKSEELMVSFSLPEMPDALWVIHLFPKVPNKPLLDRKSGVLQSLGTFATGVRTLREGDREIGPLKGQEILTSVPNSGGRPGHLFIWETQGEGTLQRPFIKVSFETGNSDGKGNAQATRLTDEGAIKLWDAILNTLRIRPTTPPKSSEAEPPKAPLGTVSTTGHLCPQSGLWCAEEGEQRFVTEGERMPKTRIPVAPNLLQRLRGERPVGELATHWTLVAFEAPEASATAPAAASGTPQAEAQTPPAADGGSPEDRA